MSALKLWAGMGRHSKRIIEQNGKWEYHPRDRVKECHWYIVTMLFRKWCGRLFLHFSKYMTRLWMKKRDWLQVGSHRRGSEWATQNMPLGHICYSEPKVTENKQTQERSCLPRSLTGSAGQFLIPRDNFRLTNSKRTPEESNNKP